MTQSKHVSSLPLLFLHEKFHLVSQVAQSCTPRWVVGRHVAQQQFELPTEFGRTQCGTPLVIGGTADAAQVDLELSVAWVQSRC